MPSVLRGCVRAPPRASDGQAPWPRGPIARAATTCRRRAWHGQRVSPVVPLRAVILDRDPGDITTIEDEGSVEEARQAWTQMKADLAGSGQ